MLRFLDQLENFGRARFSKTRSQGPDIDFFFEEGTVGLDRLHHRFHGRGAGNDLIDFFGNKNFHQTCACSQRSLRRHQGRADESFRAGHHANATKLIFVGAVFTSREQAAKRGRAGNDFRRFFFWRPQLTQRHNLQPAHMVQRGIRHQTRLCKPDRDRKIGDYAVTIRFSGVAVETGRKINCKHIGALICPQLIDGTARGAYRFPQRRPSANPEQAIKNNQLRSSAHVRLCRNYFLRGGQLVRDVRRKFDKSDVDIGAATEGWRDTQNLRWSATQAFELLAREFAAIVLLEGKADFDFPPKAP